MSTRKAGIAANAREQMERAIKSGDFEKADILAKQVESLELHDREMELSKAVRDYFTHKQAISDAMHEKSQIFEQERRAKSDEVNAEYDKKVSAVKKQHDKELNDLENQRKERMEVLVSKEDHRRERALRTAAQLARGRQFDEARSLQEHADTEMCTQSEQKQRELKEYFDWRRDELVQRQSNEITLLEEMRAAELAKIAALFEVSIQNLRTDFTRAIAEKVGDITRNSPPRSVPMALQMQIVRATPDPPSPRSPGESGRQTRASGPVSPVDLD
jgi:hypothetical protein